MKILILCESSGTVREAFRRMGHDAWSCDLLPADDGSPYHLQCDATTLDLENPVSIISSRVRKPDQIIQPHEFGHDASKKTCLWLNRLPRLTATSHIAPRMVNGKPRWANQTDSGQNRLGPSDTRWKERSKTYEGIADAMAAQWTTETLSPYSLL
jgi:hypothetical protein